MSLSARGAGASASSWVTVMKAWRRASRLSMRSRQASASSTGESSFPRMRPPAPAQGGGGEGGHAPDGVAGVVLHSSSDGRFGYRQYSSGAAINDSQHG